MELRETVAPRVANLPPWPSWVIKVEGLAGATIGRPRKGFFGTQRRLNSLTIGDASSATVVEGREDTLANSTSFSSTRARIGGRVRLPASWRYLAKARLPANG
jgi:hypothetical protein